MQKKVRRIEQEEKVLSEQADVIFTQKQLTKPFPRDPYEQIYQSSIGNELQLGPTNELQNQIKIAEDILQRKN